MRVLGRISVAALAAICAGAIAGPATAGQTAASAVTLKVAGGPPFHGRVSSRDPACIANRRVLLLEVEPDPGPIDFADNRTNGKGKWVFSSQLQGATVVQAKVLRSKRPGVGCRAARSRNARVRR
jgi:hypothetical protein